jgi:hypothetical protein
MVKQPRIKGLRRETVPHRSVFEKRIDVIPHCIEKETLKNPGMGKKAYISPLAVCPLGGAEVA